MRKGLLVVWLVFLFSILPLTACGNTTSPVEPAVIPPAISVQITEAYCPSIEIQVGMQIAWTNQDDVDHILWLERKDAQGTLVDAGGTDLLQPGATFSITLTEPGQYTVYCSRDRREFGTITVLP